MSSSRASNRYIRVITDVLRVPFRLVGAEGPLHIAWRALREDGWLRSYRSKLPMTRAGDPLPWYTYPAISFLSSRLRPNSVVFEYGAGNSTLWYAQRVARVVSVEDDAQWCGTISRRAPENASVVHRSDRTEYVLEIAHSDELYDVVVIDGCDRPRCAAEALSHLSPGGVIIWDNSDWADFQTAWLETFQPNGFRQLEFRGIGPINPYVWSTSILYRPGNCLAI